MVFVRDATTAVAEPSNRHGTNLPDRHANRANAIRLKHSHRCMSNEVKTTDLNLDLAFLPAWAQQSPEINRYANFEGEREDRRGGWGKDTRRDRPFGGQRPNRDRPPVDRPRGPRPPGGDARGDRGPRGREGRFGNEGQRGGRPPFEKRPELPPIGVDLNIVPEAHGVESLTKQIRMTGRAFPLFDIARLVLQKDERFSVEFRVRKPNDGTTPQPLFACVLDDTVWLNEEEAINHVLENHLATFYQVEKTPTDPPKGTYTFVAQCGMSGVVLGPPNYHDYQNKLHKLHQEQFASMPFERFKSRVKIVRDEAVVKKWLEELSFKTEYVVLNVPEPMRLDKWDDVREHFRAIHLPNIIKSVERQLVPSTRARRSGSRELQRHVIQEIEQQRRFPLKMVTTLSQQFASHGLQFFKVNKTIVHVAVARPHFLDVVSEPISEGVKRIVIHVEQHPRCTVKDLVGALAPVPAPPVAPSEPASAAPVEGQPAPEPKATHHEPTPEQKAVLADLHWLVHSGHVIEFANGELETAKKPLPKPPPPAPKKKTPPPAPVAVAEAAAPIAGSEEKPGVAQDSTPPPPTVETSALAPSAQIRNDEAASSPAGGSVEVPHPTEPEPPKEPGSPD